MRHNLLFAIIAAALVLTSCVDRVANEIKDQATTENKTAYIDGFNVHNVYVLNNCYVRFTMDGSGLDIHTNYSSNKVTKDNTPYYFMLKSPVRIGNFKDYSYFNFGMYLAANTSAEGVQLIDAIIKASDMDGKRTYTVTNPDNGAMVDIVISYK